MKTHCGLSAVIKTIVWNSRKEFKINSIFHVKNFRVWEKLFALIFFPVVKISFFEPVELLYITKVTVIRGVCV